MNLGNRLVFLASGVVAYIIFKKIYGGLAKENPSAHLGAGFVPCRKPGKLPRTTLRESYVLEYGTDALEIHADALTPDDVVLIVDDSSDSREWAR